MDEEKTQVYVYNNIFYSRAVDTKENFKVRIMMTFLSFKIFAGRGAFKSNFFLSFLLCVYIS